MDYKFNPTAGIPKTSFGKNDSPNLDNCTWFSTVQPPNQEERQMNETTTFTPVAEANAPAAAPLTDDQVAAILAASPGYITEPEVTEDEVTVH